MDLALREQQRAELGEVICDIEHELWRWNSQAIAL